MPARGRRVPRTYKSAEHYINRFQVFHPDQQRLKEQLLAIFAHGEQEHELLGRIRTELSDGLLVSREVVPNPDIYRCMRDALESRGVRVPDSVTDTQSGSFIAKRVIAAIWQDSSSKVKRDSLLLEYHNLRQEVVKVNKDILSERQEESTRIELGPASGPGQSSSSRHTEREVDNARATLTRLSAEEQQAIAGGDREDESQDEAVGRDNHDDHDQYREFQRNNQDEEGDDANHSRSDNRRIEHDANEADPAIDLIDLARPVINNRQQNRNLDLNPHQQSPPGRRSVQIIGEPQFDPYNDENVTRRNRNYNNHGAALACEEVRTAILPDPIISQDARQNAQGPNNRPDREGDPSMSELFTVMAKILNKLSPTEAVNQINQSPVGSGNSWNDAKDTKRKARKALASKFNKKMFTGKFGDNWDRHQERFLRACSEWEISDNELVDYLQETLAGDALNYVEAKVEENPNTTWTAISKLLSERYNNINRQKEISDRLHSMRYNDFHISGESPATTLDRITAYIDKMAVLALPVDRTDDAKARFISNVTRGQIWAYHAKGRIAPTASYDRVIQAFATSIRDRAELESGRYDKGSNSRKGSYRRAELYKTRKGSSEPHGVDNASDDDVFINEDESEPLTREDLICTLDTYFENAKFANHPKLVKNNNNNRFAGTKSFRNNARGPGSSAQSVGCFNCGRQGCSVAICKRPRDASRIANNITRWKELRKIDKSAKININNVQSVCASPSEANEVMVSAILVNQYDEESNADDDNEESDPFARLQETLRSTAVAHAEEKDEEATDFFGQTMFDVGIVSEVYCNKTNVLQTYDQSRKKSLHTDSTKYGSSIFHGACLDTGAQRSVCGLGQARAYDKQYPNSLIAGRLDVRFKFGEQVM